MARTDIAHAHEIGGGGSELRGRGYGHSRVDGPFHERLHVLGVFGESQVVGDPVQGLAGRPMRGRPRVEYRHGRAGGPVEPRRGDLRAGEISVGEVGAREVCLGEVGAPGQGGDHAGSGERGPGGVGARHVRAGQVRSREVRPA